MAVKTIKTNEPCNVCGSSDGKAYYDDNHSFCYSCKNHIQNDPYNSRENLPLKRLPIQNFHQDIEEPLNLLQIEDCTSMFVKSTRTTLETIRLETRYT